MPEPRESGVRSQWRFGVFEFDGRTLELHKAGRLVAARPQPLKLLALLLDRPGELVAREDLQRALWDDGTFVDFEQGVNHAVRELRVALGDVAESPRFIQTLPRRGYRFIAPVALLPPPAGPSPSRETVEPAASPGEAVPSPIPAADAAPGSSARSARRNRWAVVAASLVALAVAAFAWRTGTSRAAEAPTGLVVQPFVSTGQDAAAGVGLADAIAARLGGQRLVSIDTNAPKGSSAGRLVLDGEVVRRDAGIEVLARLHDEASAQTVWSERIRVRADQLFDVEAVIAERVVSALRLRLAAVEQDRLRRRYTANADAYAAYLRGRASLVKYTPEGARTAVDAFEAALRLDPAYALARAGLAMACADLALRFAPPPEVAQWSERAEAEARAALDLDGDLAEAHLARAAVARKREFDWNATMEASSRALVLNPNLEQAHLFRAAAYYHLGYMEEALIELERGRRLRGGDVIERRRAEGLVALFSGQFAPARAHLEELSRLSSDAIGDTYLALAYYYSGSADRGRRMLEQLTGHTSASTSARAGAALAGVLAAQGEAAAARAEIRRVVQGEYRDHHVAYSLGTAYAQLGDPANATQWLRIAADTGFPCVPWFDADPMLEPVRRLDGFAALRAYVKARREASLTPSTS